MRVKFIITILLLILSILLFSDNTYLQKDLILDNLSENIIIKQIHQDTAGIIWIATNEGLIRYDGNKEILFNRENKRLSDNEINCIVELKGNLWIGTAQGVTKITLKTGMINTYYANYESNDSLKNDNINCFFVNEKKELLIGSNEGLFLYNEKTNSFKQYFSLINDQLTIGQKMIMSVVMFKHYLILGTQDGLLLYNHKNHQLKIMNSNNSRLDSNNINTLFIIQNQIVLSTDQSVYTYNPEQDDLVVIYKSSSSLKIHTDNNTSFFINSSLPLKCQFSNQKWDIKSLNLNSQNPYYLYEDQNACLWTASNDGLVLFKKSQNDLKQLLFNKDDHVTGQIDEITLSENFCYYVSNNSLYKYNMHNKMINKIILPDQSIQITDLTSDHDGNIWIGTRKHGVYNLKHHSNILIHEKLSNHDMVETILFSQNDLVYFSDKKVKIIDINTQRLQQYNIEEHNSDKNLLHIEATSLSRLNNEIWIGTKNGLYSVNTQSSVVEKFEAQKNGLSHNSISALYTDDQKNLWIGTANGILNQYNSDQRVFKQYPLNHWISGIVQDRQKHLWISTSKGIIKFDPKHGILKKYNNNKHLLSEECVIGSIDIQHKQLIIGTINGIIHMEIADQIEVPLKTSISSFKIFDQEYLDDGIIFSERDIQLSYKNNFISFEFSGLDYFNQQDLKYAYFLKGVDANWINAGNRNFISYSNLKGGKYTLYVKTCDSEGNWSSNVQSFDFIVIPPFWQNPLFKISLILIVIIIAGISYYLRMSTLKKNQKKLELLVESRTYELANALEEINIQKKDLEHSYYKLRETQREIIELEKKNSVLAMAITANHEINQPLMIIKGNVELLEMQLESIELQHQKYLNRIHQSVERISVILEKFKCIDKIKVKKYTDHSDMIDINQMNESIST